MPLQGTLDLVSFADVTQLLSRRRLTGRLEVRSADLLAQLYLDRGVVVGMATRGRAAEVHGDPRYRLAEVSAKLLPADHGSFQFVPGARYSGANRLKLDVRTLLREARRRLEDWQSLATVIPSLEARPRPSEVPFDGEVALTAQQCRVLRALNGRRTVRELARALDLRELDVSRALKGLLESGLVELETEPLVIDHHGERVSYPIDAAKFATAAIDDEPPRIEPRPLAELVARRNGALEESDDPA